MRKPSSSSKNVIAALVAAAFGLTAGTALAQTTTSQSDQGNTPASHRHASKKSVRQVTSQVKHEREEMQESTGKLNHATAQLKDTTHRLKETQSKETRVANAEHKVKKGTRTERSHMHSRTNEPANTTPPPR